MELNVGIKHIIDGNAIIIMGAGASYGAKNAFGDFPSGSRLASELYKKCDIDPDDENDLQDASQCYEERFSTSSLISEIRTLLTCSSFTKSHTTIYSLPWMRYYTTNYDDVAMLAARENGIAITPVTLSSHVREYADRERLCVHINGHLGHLTETTIHGKFKLTANSYMSRDHIMNSEWGTLLLNDLETAKSIFIVGLSLKYDLDLSRILFSPDFISKTILISSPDLSNNAENRLKRYGTVYKIGVDNFAETIQEVQKTYTPQIKDEADRLYTAFLHDYKRKYCFQAPTPEDVFGLFLNGKYVDSLYYKTDGTYGAFVYRDIFSDIERAILNGKRILFIHSDMGNGKTACINELRHLLSKQEIHVFILINAESTKLSEEISAISNLSKTSKVLVIIDDYTSYVDILKKFTLFDNKQIQFVLTARTALNHNKMPSVLSDFAVQENDSAIFNLNRVDDTGIDHCIKVLSTPETVITALNSVATYAAKYPSIAKFSQVLTSIISYSHIHSFLRGFRDSDRVILSYYDELSKLSYYEQSNFFWLQYAIACIEIKRFDRAQRYLDTAYGLIPEDFVPFQINNQQARFYLESILCGNSLNPLKDFEAAHKLLMLPISSPNDNEYNVVQLFGYYCRKRMQLVMADKEYREVYKAACKDAHNRISQFTKNHPMYERYLRDLKFKLMRAYVD